MHLRRFRHGFVFINTNSGINEPKDLIGKKIGGTNFMPAGNIWMRGILEEYYGLPHRSVTWVTERSEDIPFDAPKGLNIVMDTSKSLNDMLVDGDIPAMISPCSAVTTSRRWDRLRIPRSLENLFQRKKCAVSAPTASINLPFCEPSAMAR